MAVLSGVVIVIFAFVGAEIATIAAAESDEPERAVAKATNAVICRVLVFYVLRSSCRLRSCRGTTPSSAIAVRRGARRDRHPGRRGHHERDRA